MSHAFFWCSEQIKSSYIDIIIYFDYAKAFDTVRHEKLLLKFRSYGIAGSLMEWIKCFIIQRT